MNALQREVSLGNRGEQEAVPNTLVEAGLVQQLILRRKGLAMALTRILARLMEVGESGQVGQPVSCKQGSALGQNDVKRNVKTQNLNTGESSVKEVEQKQKVAKRQPNVLWIASAKNGRAGGPAPSHAPTVELPPASTRVSR